MEGVMIEVMKAVVSERTEQLFRSETPETNASRVSRGRSDTKRKIRAYPRILDDCPEH